MSGCSTMGWEKDRHLLDFEHLNLQHLHLHGVLRGELLLLLLHVVGRESGAEREAVGVHDAATLLLLGEAAVWTIDSGGHGHGTVLIHGMLDGHIYELVLFLLVVDVGVVVRDVAGDVELAGGGSGVGNIEGGGTNPACAQTGKEGGTVIWIWNRHCGGGLR